MKKIIGSLIALTIFGISSLFACPHTNDGSDCDECKTPSWCDRNVRPVLETAGTTVGSVGGVVIGGAAATAAASTGAGAVVSGGLIVGGAAIGGVAGKAAGEWAADKICGDND